MRSPTVQLPPGREVLTARLAEWITSPLARRRVLALDVVSLLSSAMDRRRRAMVSGFDLVYPADLPAALALSAQGWRGGPCAREGLIVDSCLRARSTLGRPVKIFHFGGRVGREEALGESLRRRAGDGVELVGTRRVVDELWGPENHRALHAINAAQPDVVVVTLGSALVAEWVHAHAALLDAAVVWGVGPS